MTKTQYVVQQALHGYRDGHRLLQSSVQVSSSDDLELLTQSDNSDAARDRGFHEILVGYPLPSGEWYALSMTWPAPELERPGCVWTHTLLLSPEVIHEIPDPTSLMSLFRRPAEPDRNGPGRYAMPLKVAPPATSEAFSMPVDLLTTTAWALYEPPAESVNFQVAPMDRHARRQLLLRVWAQQWPELRASFSFAEAPRTARRLGSKLFDFQVTDRPDRGSWTSTGEHNTRTVVGTTQFEPPGWCRVVAADIISPGPFRQFLRSYGPGGGSNRDSLATLADIWERLPTVRGVEETFDLLETISFAFPQPSQASSLKENLLMGREEGMPNRLPEEAVLAAVAHGISPALLVTDLNLETRARILIENSPKKAALVIDSIPSRPTGKLVAELIHGLVEGLKDGVAARWPGEAEALVRLVSLHPDLATRSAIWVGADPDQLWTALRARRPQQALRSAIIGAIIEADADLSLDDVFETWQDAVPAVVRMLEEDPVQPSMRTKAVKSLSPKVLATLLSSGEAGPKLAQAVLETHQISELSRVPVEALARAFDSKQTGQKSDLALARLFSISTNSTPSKNGIVAVEAYRRIFRRASNGKLGKRAREELSLQKASTAKLAAELSTAYLRPSWKKLELLEIKEPDAFRAVLKSDGQGRLARELTVEIVESGAEVTRWQQDRIYSVVESDSDLDGLRSVLRHVWRRIGR